MLHGDSLSASDDLSSADNLFKQFGIRLGLQHDWPDLDLNCLTMMLFMKKTNHIKNDLFFFMNNINKNFL